MKKNTGKRTKKTVRTPEEQRKHRAAQAARAILAGRGNREANWDRVARCFGDLPNASTATAFAHQLGLDTIPLHLLDAVFPFIESPAA